MKKPERNELLKHVSIPNGNLKREGYNQACDDWEKFFPDAEEIKEIKRTHTNDVARIVDIKSLKKAIKEVEKSRKEHYVGLWETFGLRIVLAPYLPKGEYRLLVAPDVYKEIQEAIKSYKPKEARNEQG